MEILKVGEKIQKYAIGEDGVRINVNGTGIQLKVFFSNPDSNEIEQFKSEQNFEIRSVILENVLFFTFKIGNLEIMDAPYSPHLEQKFNINTEELETGDKGFSLNLVLINSLNGEIKNLRLIGLSKNFSKELVDQIEELKKKEFDKYDYDNNLFKLFSKYTTKEIYQMSRNYCKIKKRIYS